MKYLEKTKIDERVSLLKAVRPKQLKPVTELAGYI
jgi:hypothetical protein